MVPKKRNKSTVRVVKTPPKMEKKPVIILAITFGALLLISLFLYLSGPLAGKAFFSGGEGTIGLVGQQTGQTEQIVAGEVASYQLIANVGQNAQSIAVRFTVQFNAQVLQLQQCDINDCDYVLEILDDVFNYGETEDLTLTRTWNVLPGSLTVEYAGLCDETCSNVPEGQFVLANLQFRGQEAGSAAVILSPAEVYDAETGEQFGLSIVRPEISVIECRNNNDCSANEICNNNVCQAQVVCQADVYRCTADRQSRERCNSAGTGYLTLVGCPAGQVCSEVAGEARCGEPELITGSEICDDGIDNDGDELNGIFFEYVDCSDSDCIGNTACQNLNAGQYCRDNNMCSSGICSNRLCISNVCASLEWTCRDINAKQQCDQLGFSYQNLVRCGANERCNPATVGAATGCESTITDNDADGIADGSDNCPNVFNFEQADTDSDGRGDACDACFMDFNNDGDGDNYCAGPVISSIAAGRQSNDNCPLISNQNQADADRDGVGNVCDSCPIHPNQEQLDSDHDGVGDICDNCVGVDNFNQANSDSDSLGDACDVPQACGNGRVEGTEACDDGNTDGTEGCNRLCTALVRGYSCPTAGQACVNVCGDRFQIDPEQCDDGNTNNQDACLNSCLAARCGDGYLRIGGDEQCDDGNKNNGDGCDRLCKTEQGAPPAGCQSNAQCATGNARVCRVSTSQCLVLGDVTTSGTSYPLDVLDAIAIVNHVAGKPGRQISGELFIVADTDCVSGINILDAIKIINNVAGRTTGALIC